MSDISRKSFAERTPPRQTLTQKWPVLHYGDVPKVTESDFRFKAFGLVGAPVEWVSGIELLAEDRRGFWEERGDHNRGEPFAEERLLVPRGLK